jgi:hypothetical protein
MSTTPALIVTRPLVGPENDLPGAGYPDNSLPPLLNGGRPDNSLPGGRPGRPDNSLPPPVGIWPPRPVIWPPVPPLNVSIDDDVGISLPIYLPGSPDNTLPPVTVKPIKPANPIVLPKPPESGAMLALILPLPAAPKADGSVPAILWYGPGTMPMVVSLAPPAAPK